MEAWVEEDGGVSVREAQLVGLYFDRNYKHFSRPWHSRTDTPSVYSVVRCSLHLRRNA